MTNTRQKKTKTQYKNKTKLEIKEKKQSKQMGVKTNWTAFSGGSEDGHHNTELKV